MKSNSLIMTVVQRTESQTREAVTTVQKVRPDTSYPDRENQTDRTVMTAQSVTEIRQESNVIAVQRARPWKSVRTAVQGQTRQEAVMAAAQESDQTKLVHDCRTKIQTRQESVMAAAQRFRPDKGQSRLPHRKSYLEKQLKLDKSQS